MAEKNVTDPVSEAIHARLESLRADAAAIVDRHWQAVRAGEKEHKGWDNASCLTIRLKESQHSFSVLWGRVEWRGSKAKGTRTMLRYHIRPKVLKQRHRRHSWLSSGAMRCRAIFLASRCCR